MDTVEELGGTYFYGGLRNLSAKELFFWVMVDETMTQLGVDDAVAVAAIISGRNSIPVPGKPRGATTGTSRASLYFRRKLPQRLPFPLPTLTGDSITSIRISSTNRLGAWVGRAVPVLGWVILAKDVTQISLNTAIHYNKIARPEDRLW